MKALIFTMTCGEGHNMIAKSLADQFDQRGIENKIEQVFGYNEKRMANENKMYLWTCKHFPKTYDIIWNILRKRNSKKISNRLKKAIPYMHKKISEFNPDIIICTHHYASNNLTYMKNHNQLDDKIITATICHDFCLCPYWELSTGVDFVFQPLEITTNDLLKKGFVKEQIKTYGLPIRYGFSKIYNNKTEMDSLRKKLGLPMKSTVLITAGGNSIGKTITLLKSIIKRKLDINIVIINGRNKKNYNEINKYINKNKIDNVINLGFITNMNEYFMCADVVITRCGCSSISEILACEKPFITREKMILNEKITKRFFMEEGCALGLSKITDAGAQVEQIISSPKLYKSMVENIKKYSRPNASSEIIDFLINEYQKRK